MDNQEEGSHISVTFVGDGKNILTEKTHKDRLQKRFAFYCLGTLCLGFLLGSLLELITGPLGSPAVYVSPEGGAPTEQLLSFAKVALVASTKQRLNKPRSFFATPLSATMSGVPSQPRVTASRGSLAFALAKEVQQQNLLIEKTAIRKLAPIGGAMKKNAWLDFGVTYSSSSRGPMIAIVIGGVGLSSEMANRIFELSAPLTLSILPYVSDAKLIARQARLNGYEILVHVPMEPDGPLDPGPNTLKLDLTTDELYVRLNWSLEQFAGYVGINNHMGSRFTRNAAAMSGVMDRLKQDGLLFLDSRTSALSAGQAVAYKSGAIYAARDVFLDHDLNTLGILAQFQKLEELAKRRGMAIAIAHPHEITMDILEFWLQTAERRGFSVAPLTAVVKRPQAQEIRRAAQN